MSGERPFSLASKAVSVIHEFPSRGSQLDSGIESVKSVSIIALIHPLAVEVNRGAAVRGPGSEELRDGARRDIARVNPSGP